MKFPELDEMNGRIDAKQAEIRTILDEAGYADGELDLKQVKSVDGGSEAVAVHLGELNAELADLGEKREKLNAVAAASKAMQTGALNDGGAVETGDGQPATKQRATVAQIAKAILASDAVRQKGVKVDLDIDVKTLFETSAGWAPESIRSGLVVDDAQRPIQVTDVLPTIPTGQAAYKYMEETTFTNNAAERAEGGAYAESAFALTERSVTIESVGTFIPVTDEQLEDVEGAEAYLESRLTFSVRQRVDSQILVGDGTTPNIEGINNVSGIQTQAKGADPTFDAFHKGITKVRVTGRAMPSAGIWHPNDWQDVRLTRTTDGIYILGNPADPGPERLFGVRVVQSDAQTENTAVVGDFANFSLLVVRRGMEVKVSDSHSTYFTNGRQAIRAGVRIATVWLRPAAFCTVTGI